MYSKCKCCKPIVSNRLPHDSKRELKFQQQVETIEASKKTEVKKTISYVIKNGAVKKINKKRLHPDTLTTSVENPFGSQNLLSRLPHWQCSGLDERIYMVDVIADMVNYKIIVIAKNIRGDVVAEVQTIKSAGPSSATQWHFSATVFVKRGDNPYTYQLNKNCSYYYEKIGAKK